MQPQVDTDPGRLDMDVIHGFLSQSYWARGIPRGLAKGLIAAVVAEPRLQGLRRWLLVTRDAHGLYAPFGFEPLAAPDRFMELHAPDVYATREARIRENGGFEPDGKGKA